MLNWPIPWKTHQLPKVTQGEISGLNILVSIKLTSIVNKLPKKKILQAKNVLLVNSATLLNNNNTNSSQLLQKAETVRALLTHFIMPVSPHYQSRMETLGESKAPYRPVPLINNDMKILHKISANQIKQGLKRIIGYTKAGFISSMWGWFDSHAHINVSLHQQATVEKSNDYISYDRKNIWQNPH